jgi:hypothetical protein
MSLHEYVASRDLAALDPPFYALIFAAVRKADTHNLAKLRAGWPAVVAEFEARYNAPGGILSNDPVSARAAGSGEG